VRPGAGSGPGTGGQPGGGQAGDHVDPEHDPHGGPPRGGALRSITGTEGGTRPGRRQGRGGLALGAARSGGVHGAATAAGDSALPPRTSRRHEAVTMAGPGRRAGGTAGTAARPAAPARPLGRHPASESRPDGQPADWTRRGPLAPSRALRAGRRGEEDQAGAVQDQAQEIAACGSGSARHSTRSSADEGVRGRLAGRPIASSS